MLKILQYQIQSISLSCPKCKSSRLVGTNPGVTATLRCFGGRNSKSGQRKHKHPSVGPGYGTNSERADIGRSHHPTTTGTQEVGTTSL